MGYFEATSSRKPQEFTIPKPQMAKVVKLRLLTHHGNEFYCTMSSVQIFGTTQWEEMGRALEENEQQVKIIKNALDGNAGESEGEEEAAAGAGNETASAAKVANVTKAGEPRNATIGALKSLSNHSKTGSNASKASTNISKPPGNSSRHAVNASRTGHAATAANASKSAANASRPSVNGSKLPADGAGPSAPATGQESGNLSYARPAGGSIAGDDAAMGPGAGAAAEAGGSGPDEGSDEVDVVAGAPGGDDAPAVGSAAAATAPRGQSEQGAVEARAPTAHGEAPAASEGAAEAGSKRTHGYAGGGAYKVDDVALADPVSAEAAPSSSAPTALALHTH